MPVGLKDVLVVTGFIPIPGHPRPAAAYETLGLRLWDLNAPILRIRDETVEDTWLHKFIQGLPFKPTHSVADNPAKNTLAYHCVQHEKFKWLLHASEVSIAKVFVWLDFGIMHVPGVTPDVINEMLERLASDQLQIPGCWALDTFRFDDTYPCWRFCGGLMVVPRTLVKSFALGAMGTAMQRLVETQNATFEVNTLTHLERKHKVPIQWYAADHNESMFRNYPGQRKSVYTGSWDTIA